MCNHNRIQDDCARCARARHGFGRGELAADLDNLLCIIQACDHDEPYPAPSRSSVDSARVFLRRLRELDEPADESPETLAWAIELMRLLEGRVRKLEAERDALEPSTEEHVGEWITNGPLREVEARVYALEEHVRPWVDAERDALAITGLPCDPDPESGGTWHCRYCGDLTWHKVCPNRVEREPDRRQPGNVPSAHPESAAMIVDLSDRDDGGDPVIVDTTPAPEYRSPLPGTVPPPREWRCSSCAKPYAGHVMAGCGCGGEIILVDLEPEPTDRELMLEVHPPNEGSGSSPIPRAWLRKHK